MTVQVFRARERRTAPWKNGGGATREIAAFPPGAGLDAFDWRVSMATVSAGGPFSIFPGVDRVLSVLEGELTLTFASAVVTLDPRSAPHPFPGDVPVTAAAPPTPVTDLNVMTRRGRVRAMVTRLPPRAVAAAADTTLIFALSATSRLSFARVDYPLELHDAVLISNAEGEPIDLASDSPEGSFQIDFA